MASTPPRRWVRWPTTAASRRSKGWWLTLGKKAPVYWREANGWGGRGYFFPVTVLTELPDDARAMHEETVWSAGPHQPRRVPGRGHPKGQRIALWPRRLRFHELGSQTWDQLTEGVEAGNLSINTLEASVAENRRSAGSRTAATAGEGGAEGALTLHDRQKTSRTAWTYESGMI